MDSRVIDFASARNRLLEHSLQGENASDARSKLDLRQNEYLEQMIEADCLQLKEEQPGVFHSADCFARTMRKRAKTRFAAIERLYLILLKEKVKEIERLRTGA